MVVKASWEMYKWGKENEYIQKETGGGLRLIRRDPRVQNQGQMKVQWLAYLKGKLGSEREEKVNEGKRVKFTNF